jgi:long-chain acyl-CoA synthetase
MLKPNEYIADWPDMPYANFSEWLSDIAAAYGDKTAIFYRSGKQKDFTRWSFKKLEAESQRLGRGFLAAGLKKGDRVVLWAENRPEWMATWLAAAVSGLVVVPVDFLVPKTNVSTSSRSPGPGLLSIPNEKRPSPSPWYPRGLTWMY